MALTARAKPMKKERRKTLWRHRVRELASTTTNQENTNRARRPGVIVEGSAGGDGVTITGTLANPYLWRASLDVIDFMPIRQVDPISGIIITDWYEFPEQPGTRYKVDIRVLGRTLRADYLTVSVFKEQRDPVQEWQTVAVDPETRLQLEETIITKARELKQSSR